MAVGPLPVLRNTQEKRIRVSNCLENHIFPAYGGEMVELILVSLVRLIGDTTSQMDITKQTSETARSHPSLPIRMSQH
jgi:hypothetical protein